MSNKMDKEELKNLTSGYLNSIPDIEYLEEGGVIKFSKNKFIFGKIQNDKILLLDGAGRFTEVEPNLLEEKDDFLRAATKAYWTAAGVKASAEQRASSMA